MRVSWQVTSFLLCSIGSIGAAHGAEPTLGLKGQLYYEDAPASVAPQNAVPMHIAQKHIARAPIDFSYPESAATAGSNSGRRKARRPAVQSGWNLELSDGAKLKFAYDKDTKLSLGMGMWKVKVGVSKKIGGPSSTEIDWPERHGSAAGMGRAGTSVLASSSN